MKAHFQKLTLLGLILLPALIVFSARYNSATAHTEILEDPDSHPAEWVSCAFSLTDEEGTAVKEAQDTYTPECAKLCKDFMNARKRLNALADNLATPEKEIEEATARLASCYQHCQTRGLAHVREIARKLPEDQRETYLSIMIPGILGNQDDPHMAFNASH